jgi:hypothetical protein
MTGRRRDSGCCEFLVHPNNYEEWERLVEALARHCRKQRFEVAAWEVCNEPDIGESGGTPHLFRHAEDYNRFCTSAARMISATGRCSSSPGTSAGSKSNNRRTAE